MTFQPWQFRAALAADLRAAFAAAGVDADVIEYARLDAPKIRPRVFVVLRSFREAGTACAVRSARLELHAVVPNTSNDGTADDAADAFAWSVLDAVASIPRTYVPDGESTERGEFADTGCPGFVTPIERQAL